MIRKRDHKRAMSLCMWDFTCDRQTVIKLLRAARTDYFGIGQKTGKKGIIKKNFVAAWEPWWADEEWDLVVERLLKKLGGPGNVKHILDTIDPKRAWVQVDLPAIGSPYVETNNLSLEVVRDIASMGLGFGIELFHFSSDEPTHHPRSARERIIAPRKR